MADAEIRRFFRVAGSSLVVFGVFLNLLMLTVPIYMLQIYDRVLASESLPTLWALTAIGVFALLIFGGLEACRSHFVNRLALRLENSIGPKVLQAGVVIGLQDRTINGSACIRDLEKVRNLFTSGALSSLVDVPWFPIYLVVIYLFHPVLGLVALAGAAILVGLALTNELTSRRLMAVAMQKQDELLRFSDGVFRCSEASWAMGHMPAIKSKWSRIQFAGATALIRALHRGGNIKSWSKSARQGVQLALLCAGAGLAIDGAISAGVMVVASIIMGRALAPIEQTIGNWRTIQSSVAAWKRTKKLLSVAPPINEKLAFDTDGNTLQITNCSFLPNGARLPTIRNLSMEVAAGEVLALIGPSGSGKTTLAKLMAGILVPSVGTVTIGGHNVSQLAPSQASELIGYVPQDFGFIPGSIVANISGFSEESASDRVVCAAKLAGVHELIQAQPDGYRTQLAKSSVSNPFSRGQLQRLSLARALYGDPAFVVMDEPSASLDQAGEELVVDAIGTLKKAGKSVVVVAHRPSIITHADRVAVLNNGSLEAIGKYTDILPHVIGGPGVGKRSGSAAPRGLSPAASRTEKMPA